MNKNSIGRAILDALILVCPHVIESMKPIGSDGTPRKGYAICIIKKGFGDGVWSGLAGDFDGRDAGPYERNALNKCLALMERADPTVITSWQIRNPDALPPIFGGGVMFIGPDGAIYYVAISGLPEEDDTAVVTRTLSHLKLVSPGWCSDVLVRTNYSLSIGRAWGTPLPKMEHLRHNMAMAA